MPTPKENAADEIRLLHRSLSQAASDYYMAAHDEAAATLRKGCEAIKQAAREDNPRQAIQDLFRAVEIIGLGPWDRAIESHRDQILYRIATTQANISRRTKEEG